MHPRLKKTPFGVFEIVAADNPDIPPAAAIQAEAAQRARLKPNEERDQQRTTETSVADAPKATSAVSSTAETIR